MFHASKSSLKDVTAAVASFAPIFMVPGMYDFTRLMRAIVCGEIDLCQNFESGFPEEFPQKKNHDCIVV